MGGDASVIHHRIEREARAEPEMVVSAATLSATARLSVCAQGEIIGLAGLEGHGQKALCAPSTWRDADRRAP